MEDIARLGFAADTSELVKAEKDLNALEPAAKRAETAADKLDRKMNQLGGGMGVLGSKFKLLREFAIGFASAVGAGFSIAAFVQLSDQYTALTNTLRVVAGEQGNVNQLLEDLNGIAQRTRAPLAATAQLYQRLSVAGKELGVSEKQVLRFTENIGLALAQQGGSAEAASGALMQLSQAMGGGVVRAEEFNSMLEGAYPIVLAAAKGIDEAGGSVAKLRNMMLEGRLTSKQFFDAILSQTDDLEKTFANTTPTISQAFGRLREELMLSVGAFNELTGASGVVASAIIFFANHLQEIGVYLATGAATITALYIPAIWAATAATRAWIFSLITLRGALIASGIGAFVVLAGTLINVLLKIANNVGGLGNAFTALGEVAELVWKGIKDSAGAIPPALAAVWEKAKAEFFLFVSDISYKWADFLTFFKSGLEAIGAINLADQLASGPIAGATEFANDMTVAADAAQKLANTKLGESVDVLKDAFGPAREKLAELTKGIDDMNDSAGDGIPPAGGLSGALGDLGDKAGGAAGKTQELKTALQLLTEEFNKLSEPFDQASSAFDALDKAKENGIITNDQYVASLKRIQDAFLATGGTADQWAKIIGKNTETVASKLDDLANRSIGDLSNSFADLAVDGKNSFGDLAKSVIKQLIAMAMQAMLTRLAMAWIPGFAQGGVFGGDALTGALQGAGVGAVQPFAKGGTFTNQIVNRPTPFKFARGGGFSAGVMGEAGPEAVMPLSRGPDGSLGVQMYGDRSGQTGGNERVAIDVYVHAEEGEMFRPTVQAIARDEAVTVSQNAAQEMNAQLPDRVEQIINDPRLKGA